MFDSSTLDHIKADWQRILGPDGCGKGAVCPACGSGSGKKGTGLSPIPGTNFELKCFGCGERHDVLGWVAIKLGLDIKADFKKIVEYCDGGKIDYSVPVKFIKKPEEKPPTFERDYQAYFDECAARLDQTDYWSKRGLSLDTCRHFNVGYDPAFKHKKFSDKAPATPRLIIPTSDHAFLARDTRDNLKSKFEREHTKLQEGTKSLFNPSAMENDVVFVVEGEIDAMSIWQVGFQNVVGLSSINQSDYFIDITRALKHHRPKALIISLDNESKPQVKAAKNKIVKAANELGIATLDGSDMFAEFKDANELLVADPDLLRRNCQAKLDEARNTQPPITEPKVGKKDKGKKNTAPAVSDCNLMLSAVFDDCPVDLAIPDAYTVKPDGIWLDDLIVSYTPVFPSGVIINHHSRNHRIKLAFRLRDGWAEEVFDASVIADSKQVLALTDKGINTRSGASAKALVEFLSDIKAVNEYRLPRIEEYEQPGWNTDFDDFRLPDRKGYYMPALEEMLEVKGDAQAWFDRAARLRHNVFHRTMIAASFAAPLLRLPNINLRTFGIFLHGTSRSGKTTCQRFALSAWGNSKMMMVDFSGTRNGLEAALVRSNDLPVMVDEFTNVKDKDVASNFGYMFANEKPRVRMTKSIRERPTHPWRTVAIMTGEHKMLGADAKEGAINRIIELELRVGDRLFDNELDADALNNFMGVNHGAAGRLYVEQIISHIPLIDKHFYTFRRDLLALNEAMTKPRAPEHVKHAASLATADFLLNHLIYGMDEEAAHADTMSNFIEPLLKRLPSADALKEEFRAWSILIQYIKSHRAQFYGDHLEEEGIKPSREMYGEIKWSTVATEGLTFKKGDKEEEHKMIGRAIDEVIMLTESARRVLKDAGFSDAKMMRAFRDRGWVPTESDGSFVRKAFGGTTDKVRVLVIDRDHFTDAI
ncbi:MAG: DUF927 domain-containing protein [Selenomonadaceae bacterium]|nr:DUF927 domain-containing protein [Selenomonadaceae bacterium]